MEKKLYYGCAYYPELWEENEVERDIAHMQNLSINVVRMGEFSWSFLEPEEDRFQADYFMSYIHRLNMNGIKTILCTPSATPPIWMTDNHPERLFVNEKGERLGHGSRQHCCIDQEYFRKRVGLIVEEMAKAAEGSDGVIGWQIDNELKCHVDQCHCTSCVNQWHSWLEKKYGFIEHLNNKWGTGVWSQHYQNFSQVPAPGATPFLHNPSLVQEYKVFSREKTTEFCHMQAEIIRKYSKSPITHNTGEYFALDNPALFSGLDFASFDDYADAKQYKIMLRSYDYFRTVKENTPFFVMETSPNHNGCTLGTQQPHPAGYLKAESAAAYLSGAQGFSYWLFRQQRAGCEIPHGSILYAWGEPTTGYEEVRQAGLVKNRLEPYLCETKAPKGRIALMYSDLARMTFETEPLEGFDYWQMIQNVYENDIPHDIECDVIHEGSSLQGYEILYTPFMAVVTDEFLEKALAYVKSGGTWIAGPMCGFRTSLHTVPQEGGFGKLEKYAGAKVKYMQKFTGCGIKGNAFLAECTLSMVGAVLESASADVIGRISSGRFTGEAFATEKVLEKGRFVLVGARPALSEDKDWGHIMISHYLKKENANQWRSSQGIKTIVRYGENNKKYLFAVDMEGSGGELLISAEYEVKIGKKSAHGLKIDPYETVLAILKQ